MGNGERYIKRKGGEMKVLVILAFILGICGIILMIKRLLDFMGSRLLK